MQCAPRELVAFFGVLSGNERFHGMAQRVDARAGGQHRWFFQREIGVHDRIIRNQGRMLDEALFLGLHADDRKWRHLRPRSRCRRNRDDCLPQKKTRKASPKSRDELWPVPSRFRRVVWHREYR